MSLDDLPEPIKHFVDGLALLATVGTVIKMLPAIASALSIVWMGIRIWETPTVQALKARWRKEGS